MAKYIKFDMQGDEPVKVGEVESVFPNFEGVPADEVPEGRNSTARDYRDADGKWFRVWRGIKKDGSLVQYGYTEIK